MHHHLRQEPEQQPTSLVLQLVQPLVLYLFITVLGGSCIDTLAQCSYSLHAIDFPWEL